MGWSSCDMNYCLLSVDFLLKDCRIMVLLGAKCKTLYCIEFLRTKDKSMKVLFCPHFLGILYIRNSAHHSGKLLLYYRVHKQREIFCSHKIKHFTLILVSCISEPFRIINLLWGFWRTYCVHLHGECTALIQVAAEVTWRKKCTNCATIKLRGH